MSTQKKLAVLVALLLVSLGALAQQPVNLSQVVGVAPAAAGANVSTDSAPLTVAGSDYGGTAVKRIFKVDSAGKIYVSTVDTITTITNNVGVTQQTNPWIVAGGGTAGSAASGVVTVQGIASMTKLLVTPDSVALPANQSMNVAQVNAHTTVEATTGVQKVGIVGNIGAVFDGPTGSPVPANAILMGGTDGTNTVAPYIDPCQRGAKTKTLINLAATTATKLVALASAKVIYVCSLNIVVAGANNVALISGTKVTTECDTSTVGVAGGTTAAAGWNFAANGGLTLGNGSSWVLSGGTALDLCILASANTQVSGSITTVTF